ncbi:MAG: CoB--CoM heterodisulfide reductase iron-sulfur subunit A family protein, partial [Thermoplasmata archaeon]|nr:CoB--CoM heterodisulfide reductase iron-sulfur subunit A family protein [Thermoplasmata archaeon]
RICSALGPYSDLRGLVRPSDMKVPHKIGFIQCVGSRDQAIGQDYCSSACCMITLKAAIMVKELQPEAEVNIYFMDMRAFGKGYHRYYEQAKSLGINFVRNRPAAVGQIEASTNLEIEYVTEAGEPKKDELELVVLAIGLGAPKFASELGKVFKIELDEFGFCKPRDFSKLATSQDGIYVCGGFSGPKDIPDTITEATAVAGKVAEGLGRPKPEVEPSKPEIKATDTDEEPNIGVFICDCGGEIGQVLELDTIFEHMNKLHNVTIAEAVDYLCLKPEVLKIKLKGGGINRVVLGACAAYNYAPKFNRILMEAGLNPALLEIVNLREQGAWAHQANPAQATSRAKSQLAMAVEKLRDEEYLTVSATGLTSKVLVLGGGIAGMTAALTTARAGMGVELVERDAELGGNIKNIYRTLDGKDVQELLKHTISEIDKNENITVHLNTELTQLRGYFGNFRATLTTGDEAQDLEYGALILATGAKEYEPTEYLFGQDDRIMTQLELEEMLMKGDGRKTKGKRLSPHASRLS